MALDPSGREVSAPEGSYRPKRNEVKTDKPISAKDILNQTDIVRNKTTPYITALNNPDIIFEDP